MDNIIVRVIKKLNSYKRDPLAKKFIKHNQEYFNGGQNNSKSPIVLFEFNWLHPSHIAYSYLANVLAEKYGARIVAYRTSVPKGVWGRLEWLLSGKLLLRDFAIYRSFGTSEFFIPKLTGAQSDRAVLLSNQIISSIKSKSDVETICIDGIELGDLIYDSYLRTFNKPTIQIEDKRFKDFLASAIALYVFWDDYFKEHDVRAVSVSHCTYIFAIPLRIAIGKGIPGFDTAARYVYRLGKKHQMSETEFLEFRQLFAALPSEAQASGIAEAKRRIDLRFSGQVGVDMDYSTKSAYGAHKAERLLKESARTKVLIAAHCFFDNPHSYGKNLFPDFYEWLDFIGKMTIETDYDWYIKTHPDYLPGTMEIINYFLDKYPKITLLPADSSHHQIVAEGINVALTCYGTIGLEYAAMGIPVVNASLNNPHIAYNFNLHPKNVDAYRNILKHLDRIELKIDKNEVYEYYFMRHIYYNINWLFEDYKTTSDEVIGDSKLYAPNTPKIYDAWIKECTPKKHASIIAALNTFIDSGDFRLGDEHFIDNSGSVRAEVAR